MARKRYQFGSVRKVGKVWYGRFREDRFDGPRKQRSLRLGTIKEYPTEKLAIRALQARLIPINDPLNRPGRIINFGDFVQEYRGKVLAMLKPSTQSVYNVQLNRYILPALGRMDLDRISVDVQQGFVMSLVEKGVARVNLDSILGVLGAVLSRAKKWHCLVQPLDRGNLVLPPKGVSSPRFFTPDEARRIIAAAEEPYRTMYVLAATTGMRAGEIMGLRWQDVDFVRGVIAVEQTAWHGRIQAPKTHHSKASLPMPSMLGEMIARLPRKGELIFSGDRAFRADYLIKRQLRPLLDRLGIERGGWHAFRHLHASMLISGGASIKVAQEQLRHTNPSLTLNLYSHVIGDARRVAVERLSAELWSNVANVGSSVQ